MKSTISSKGQITVPAALREKIGLTPGTRVRFELCEGGILIKKGADGDHPVNRVFGCLKLSQPVDALIDELRGPRPGANAEPHGGKRVERRRRVR